jgi:hypothetical protein
MPNLAGKPKGLPYSSQLQIVKCPEALDHLEHDRQWRRLQIRVNTFELSLQRDRVPCLKLRGCDGSGNRLMTLVMLCEHLVDEKQVAVRQHGAVPKSIDTGDDARNVLKQGASLDGFPVNHDLAWQTHAAVLKVHPQVDVSLRDEFHGRSSPAPPAPDAPSEEVLLNEATHHDD